MFFNNIIKYIDNFVYQFGFFDSIDFYDSMYHSNLLFLTIPVAAFSSFFTHAFGLTFFTSLMFVLLLVLELLSGLMATKIKGNAIASRKLSRFGLKIVVWFGVFAFVNALMLQYYNVNVVMYNLYYWVHNLILSYVSFEYLISVLENVAVISGKSNNKLIKALSTKFESVLGISDTEDFFNERDNILAIINEDYSIIKANVEWETQLSYYASKLIGTNLNNYIQFSNNETIDDIVKGLNSVTRLKKTSKNIFIKHSNDTLKSATLLISKHDYNYHIKIQIL